jgi:hypothetical protein
MDMGKAPEQRGKTKNKKGEKECPGEKCFSLPSA